LSPIPSSLFSPTRYYITSSVSWLPCRNWLRWRISRIEPQIFITCIDIDDKHTMRLGMTTQVMRLAFHRYRSRIRTPTLPAVSAVFSAAWADLHTWKKRSSAGVRGQDRTPALAHGPHAQRLPKYRVFTEVRVEGLERRL
jgi:hypothetical protein